MKLQQTPTATPLIVAGGVLLALVLAITTSIVSSEQPVPDLPSPDYSYAAPIEFGKLDRDDSLADLERGRAYYAQLCAGCHGSSGRGDGVWAYRVTPKPVDLTSARVRGRSDEFLFDVISDGLVGTPMMGLEDRLSAVQRQQLVIYLRHLITQSPTGAEAEA